METKIEDITLKELMQEVLKQHDQINMLWTVVNKLRFKKEVATTVAASNNPEYNSGMCKEFREGEEK